MSLTGNNTPHINGYRVFPFEHEKQFLQHLSKENWNNILVAINAEKLMKQDEVLRELVNENIGYPDGVGAVYALKKKGYKAGKIAGAEFWLEIVRSFYKEKSFYLIGGKDQVIQDTVTKLNSEFPGINIVNYHNGYFNEDRFVEIQTDIQKRKPDVVFVAMGSPRQEIIMQKMKQSFPALYMGLGGSFDVYTGRVKRAPNTWIKLNLEWAYRLVKEPVRIFRQVVLVKFMFLLLRNKL